MMAGGNIPTIDDGGTQRFVSANPKSLTDRPNSIASAGDGTQALGQGATSTGYEDEVSANPKSRGGSEPGDGLIDRGYTYLDEGAVGGVRPVNGNRSRFLGEPDNS
jgi:hypothetical protein